MRLRNATDIPDAMMRQLHDLRVAEADLAASLAKKRGDFEEMLTDERDAHAVARQMRETMEEQVRAAALAAYAETGERKPFLGVEVKNFTKLIYDPSNALAWAKAHGIALRLDEKTFEKIAATPGTVECVTILEEPRAQIARDLAALAS